MLTCANCSDERIPANIMLIAGVPHCPECVSARDERVLANRRVEPPPPIYTTPIFRPAVWGKKVAERTDLGLLVLDGSDAETKDARAVRKDRAERKKKEKKP